MKAKILILFVIAIITNSCNKGKYTDKPQLTFKSVNTGVLNPNQVITFDIEFTDAQGDVQDTLWVQKVTKNCKKSDFVSGYRIPGFPATKNLKGVFEVSLAYGFGLGYPAMQEPACTNQNDTCVFNFWAKDLAGNKSDTLAGPTIIIVHR
jgi:hypothetical protein